MRLSEGKIKLGILHPDKKVREMAVRYFADAFSQDPAIMPLVVRAIERYGRDEAVSRFAVREGLVQNDETLTWILGEVAKERARRLYCMGLLDLLTQADVHLLAKYQSQILELEGLDLNVREAVTDRIKLLSADPDDCWRELGEFCEREKTKRYVNEVNFSPANRLLEAIARHGQAYAGRVLSILGEEVENFTNHPMKWLEPLTVRLAGEMRLEAAIPLIVKKLREDNDVLRSECERALWKIGTDAVVETVCTDYAQSDWSYRLAGADVLERIHSDLTVTKVLELLPLEKENNISVWLGHALVRQLAFEGVEPLRRLILDGPLDPEMRGLRQDFLTACTLMEVRFPEFEQWTEDAKDDREANKKFYAERHPGVAALGEYADRKVRGEILDDEMENEAEEPVRERVGRNEPCPCGSGKKFKKCCLKKQGGKVFE